MEVSRLSHEGCPLSPPHSRADFAFSILLCPQLYRLPLRVAFPFWRVTDFPCSAPMPEVGEGLPFRREPAVRDRKSASSCSGRSEEHTSELQSPCNLVCRLLLEKKKKDYVGE